MSQSTISIYCQLPKVIESNTELYFAPTNWVWKKCLAFPVNELSDFSPKPYKWMRYNTGAVIGAHGDLCTERDSSEPVPIDYDSDLPAVSLDLYYHTTAQEKCRMLPIDPKFAMTRTTTSGHDEFWKNVKERDETCVVTRVPSKYCAAAHLVPRSKGDTYIETFTKRRTRASDGEDIVREIDSVRNGLFLHESGCRGLGRDVAFLKTPNFAMDTSDAVSDARGAQERLTYHVFDKSIPALLPELNRSSVRIPADMRVRPPTVLFDAGYASAVLRHFGCLATDDLERWELLYQAGEFRNVTHADDKRIKVMT